jgi:hypothetical protein
MNMGFSFLPKKRKGANTTGVSHAMVDAQPT